MMTTYNNATLLWQSCLSDFLCFPCKGGPGCFAIGFSVLNMIFSWPVMVFQKEDDADTALESLVGENKAFY